MRSIVLHCVMLALAMPLWAEDPPAAMSPAAVTRFAEMMERDWKQRPPWAEMAVMILKGDRMGSGAGWFTGSQRRHDWNWLATNFASAADDERIERDEISQLDEDVFARIDTDGDNVITPADFDFSKNPLMEDDSPAGDIFSLLDDDSNGRLTMDELRRWFDRSTDGSDFLSVDDLKGALGFNPKTPGKKDPRGERRDPRWKMLELLLNGEMGSFAAGPDLDAEAPELDLPLVAHKDDGGGLELTDRFVKLADVRGQKSVVLVFGSFT